jgi:hypothetical protein
MSWEHTLRQVVREMESAGALTTTKAIAEARKRGARFGDGAAMQLIRHIRSERAVRTH